MARSGPRAWLLVALAASAGCAERPAPYRFAMPMLGATDAPAEVVARPPGSPSGEARGITAGGRARRTSSEAGAPRPARTTYAYGWQADAQSGLRTVHAGGIALEQATASAADADAVAQGPVARAGAWQALPAPHRSPTPGPGGVAVEAAAIRPRELAMLRRLVGARDRRYSFAIVMQWTETLGLAPELAGPQSDATHPTVGRPTDGPGLVEMAQARGLRRGPGDLIEPGDLLVFDRALSGSAADLIALAIARDERGVVEFVYVGGGVVRRGHVDPTRPTLRRDLRGLVVNTFLRHGARQPPRGTRYLSGELLGHVIRTR